MDRRYYGLKALIAVVVVCVAVFSSTFGPRPYASSVVHIRYGAAATIQSTLMGATFKVSHVVGEAVRRYEGVIPRWR